MRIKRLVLFLLPVLAMGMALTGCGSGSSASSETGSSGALSSSSGAAAASGGGQVLTLAADPSGNLKYDKSSLTANAGKVTIEFTNNSSMQHDVVLQSGTSGPNLAQTPTFSGGSKSFTVTLKAGKYTYYCSVPGHRAAGMLGTLTVN